VHRGRKRIEDLFLKARLEQRGGDNAIRLAEDHSAQDYACTGIGIGQTVRNQTGVQVLEIDDWAGMFAVILANATECFPAVGSIERWKQSGEL
jgi:hypothetical protein